MTAIQSFTIPTHVSCAPRIIASQRCDSVPVSIVRINQNHSVVSGASSQCASSRIEYSVDTFAVPELAILFIFLLYLGVIIVPDKEIPLYGIVLTREAMEYRYVVVIG